MPDAAPVTETTTRPRLLLLDGHSIAYRAFFALPVENFSTTTGQHTNAVFGFTSMLINVLRDEQPTHIGGRVRQVAADLPPRRSTPSTRRSATRRPTSSPASSR